MIALVSTAAQAGVEAVLETVAQEVEAQGRQQDRSAGEDGGPGLSDRKLRLSASIRPSEGVGDWVPRPRNDRLASTKMAVESDRLVCTRIIPDRFGSRWRSMIVVSVEPQVRAAAT
jgi:hypothetical protein